MTGKKRFRSVGVPYGKSVADYAKRLETAMNKLSDEGYAFQITEQKNGSVIVGQLVVRPEVPEVPESPKAASFSTKTRELIESAVSLQGRRSRAALVGDLPKHAAEITRGFGAEDLRVAAEELDLAATEHEGETLHHRPCDYLLLLRALADIVKQAARLSLQ